MYRFPRGCTVKGLTKKKLAPVPSGGKKSSFGCFRHPKTRTVAYSRNRSGWKKTAYSFSTARDSRPRARTVGARMQIMVKAKYKGPIVSRYCAVAGKIKVAGPWARGPYIRLHPEKHTRTHVHSCTHTHGRPKREPRVTRSSRPALDVSLIFINDSEFEFLHRWYGNRARRVLEGSSGTREEDVCTERARRKSRTWPWPWEPRLREILVLVIDHNYPLSYLVWFALRRQVRILEIFLHDLWARNTATGPKTFDKRGAI